MISVFAYLSISDKNQVRRSLSLIQFSIKGVSHVVVPIADIQGFAHLIVEVVRKHRLRFNQGT